MPHHVAHSSGKRIYATNILGEHGFFNLSVVVFDRGVVHVAVGMGDHAGIPVKDAAKL